tara:strand:- start:3 stop:479 length:477 start_codon:yes stop_codon:yes gene_type:complete
MTTVKITAFLKRKAPDGYDFYTDELSFIRWCTYITKHLTFIPFEIWGLIFKKVQMSAYQYNYDFIFLPKRRLAELNYQKDKRERIASKHIKVKQPRFPCREYKLSTGTFKAYYVEKLFVVNGCPYLYMDKKHNVKHCLWDKLGNQIKSYKLPKFVLDY